MKIRFWLIGVILSVAVVGGLSWWVWGRSVSPTLVDTQTDRLTRQAEVSPSPGQQSGLPDWLPLYPAPLSSSQAVSGDQSGWTAAQTTPDDQQRVVDWLRQAYSSNGWQLGQQTDMGAMTSVEAERSGYKALVLIVANSANNRTDIAYTLKRQ